MAAIAHADSFIADSTISPSSPSNYYDETPPEKDVSSSSNTNIKRVVRTYGKLKLGTDVPITVPDDWEARARTLKTAPPNTETQVIPESGDDGDATESTKGTSAFTGYSWRDTLREIDGHKDDEDALEGGNVQNVPITEGDQTWRINTANVDGESIFEGSLSSLLSEAYNRLPSNQSTFNPPFKKPRNTNNRDSNTSDSDDTRLDLNVLNSSQVHSSDTPPTSPSKHLAFQGTSKTDEDSAGRSSSEENVGADTTKKQRLDKGKGKPKVRRTKAPTKKELTEMQKESARLLAGKLIVIYQCVKVHRADHRSGITIASLFDKIKNSSTGAVHESDPIASFSSPGRNISLRMNCIPGVRHENLSATSKPQATSTSSIPVMACPNVSVQENTQSDAGLDEIPDLTSIIREDNAERQKRLQEEKGHAEIERKAKELAERKSKALEISRSYDDSDSDDGLEIEKLLTPVKSKQPASLSNARRASLGTGGATRRTQVVTERSLELASKPMFLGKKNVNQKRGTPNAFSQKDLNGILLHRAEKQSSVIEQHKRDQWVETGGTIKDKRVAVEGTSVDVWLQKGATSQGVERKVGEEEDSDYQSIDDEGELQDEPEDGEANYTAVIMDEDSEQSDSPITFDQMDISDEDADKENHHPAPRRMRLRVIIGSDEENEDEDTRHKLRSPVVLVRDSSFAAHFHNTPIGDKENSARSTDGLNSKRQPIQQACTHVISDNEQPDNALPYPESPSPRSIRKPLGQLERGGDMSLLSPSRMHKIPSLDRILKVLHEEDKESTFGPASPIREGSTRHRTSSSPSSEALDGPTLVSPSGFSQVFDEQNKPISPVFPNRGLSQFFFAGEELSEISLQKNTIFARALSGSSLSQDATNEGFEFTQPTGLLPAVNISDSQRREIDDIFGKDQEFKLDEAKRFKVDQSAKRKSQGIPYFGSFVTTQPSEVSPQSIRQPLETLSLDPQAYSVSDENPSPLASRRRLTKRRLSTPSSPAKTLELFSARSNAFNVLRDGAVAKAQRVQHSYAKLTRSEFVEGEAQESDDELLAGFGDVGADDDDDCDEDLDAVVEGLVDDTVLDEEAQAAELILEKHLEHKAADDAEIEKIHQNAVDGKLRAKRRDRDMYFDDSDSEEDTRRPRKEFLKKRRIEGDTLEAYGNNAETRAFYDAYQASLSAAELEDLDYLGENDAPTLSQDNTIYDNSDVEPQETVDAATIRRELARSIRQSHPPASGESDTEDINWLASEDQDMTNLEGIQIQSGPLNHKPGAAQSHSISLGYSAFYGKTPTTDERSQLKAWASQEAHARISASGRGGFSRREDTGSSTSRNNPKILSKMPPNDLKRDNKSTLRRSGSSLMSHVEKRKGFDA